VPRLVICSKSGDTVRQHAPAWIVLYPDGANRAILTIAGREQVLLNPQLTDLLVAIDAATTGPMSPRPRLTGG